MGGGVVARNSAIIAIATAWLQQKVAVDGACETLVAEKLKVDQLTTCQIESARINSTQIK